MQPLGLKKTRCPWHLTRRQIRELRPGDYDAACPQKSHERRLAALDFKMGWEAGLPRSPDYYWNLLVGRVWNPRHHGLPRAPKPKPPRPPLTYTIAERLLER